MCRAGNGSPLDLAYLYQQRALAYLAKNDDAHAVADYDQAVTLSPQNADYAIEGCFWHAVVEPVADALVLCELGVAGAPDNAVAYEHRGFALLRLGRLAEAIADYDAALKLDPGNANALFGRGTARLRNGDGGGTSDIAAAEKLRPDIAGVFAGYGVK